MLTAKNSHFQTTTHLAMEAPYRGEHEVSQERLLLEEKMKTSIDRTRGTSFTVGGESLGGLHPCRINTSQGSRLKPLRIHRSMPAFDTEARLQQRDVEHMDLGGMVKNQRSEMTRNKETLGRSQVQVAHEVFQSSTEDDGAPHMTVWNKREDFATTADFGGDQKPYKPKKNSGALWNAECANAYQTESQLIHATKRPGDAALRFAARPDPNQLRAIKLHSTRSHWSIDQRPEVGDPTEGVDVDMPNTRHIESIYAAKDRSVSKRNEGLCKRGDHVGAVNPSDIFDRIKLDRARPRLFVGKDSPLADQTALADLPSSIPPASLSKQTFNQKLYTALRQRSMQDSVFALDRLRGGR